MKNLIFLILFFVTITVEAFAQINQNVTQDIEIQTTAGTGNGLNYVYTASSDLELSGFDEDLNFGQICFLRFENVSIPAGVQVNEVRLEFALKTPNPSANSFRVFIENASSAAYPTADNSDGVTGQAIQNRSYTNSIVWNVPAATNTSPPLTITSTNLSSILPSQFIGQTVNIAFKIEKNQNTATQPVYGVYSANSSYNPPKLIINYTTNTASLPLFMWSGALTHNSISVKAKLSAAENDCKLVVSTSSDFTSGVIVGPSVSVTSATNLMGQFSMANLQPNTTYYYRIKIGNNLATNLTGKFRTAPSPTASNQSFTFLAGACNRYPFGDYAGRGVNYDFYNLMGNENPLFFLSPGDLHYGDPNLNGSTNPSILNNQKAYEYLLFGNLPAGIYGANYNDALAQSDFFNSTPNSFFFNPAGGYTRQQYSNNIIAQAPKLKSFLQNVPIAYMWDDHDFSGDGSRGTIDWQQRGDFAKKTYRDYVPHYPFPSTNTAANAPIYQAFTSGRVRFIMMDLRSEQTNNDFISAQQLCWFKAECLNAKKNNQLIAWISSVGPTSYKNDLTLIDDLWGQNGKRNQRTEIFQWLNQSQINNLFIIAGDAHAMGIDDGDNTDCANSPNTGTCERISNTPRYPLFQVAPLFQDVPSDKNVKANLLRPLDFFNNADAEKSRGHYTKFTVEDTGGATITVKSQMYRVENNAALPYTLNTSNYTTTNQTSESYIINNNTYAFKRTIQQANPFNITPNQSISQGSSITLAATCIGTLTWLNNSTNTTVSATVTPTTTTTYTARCDVGCGTVVDLGSVTITIAPPCGGLQNLTVTNSTPPLYEAIQHITTSGTIDYLSGSRKEYLAGRSITITPPAGGGHWQTDRGSVFLAAIDDELVLCNTAITSLYMSTNGTASKINVAWTHPNPSLVDNFKLVYALGNGSWITYNTFSNSTFTINHMLSSGLSAYATYRWKVIAVKNGIEYPSPERTVVCTFSGQQIRLRNN